MEVNDSFQDCNLYESCNVEPTSYSIVDFVLMKGKKRLNFVEMNIVTTDISTNALIVTRYPTMWKAMKN
jgi:hypothetical protein